MPRLILTPVLLGLLLVTSGCGNLPFFKDRPRGDATAPVGTTRPQARPGGIEARTPSPDARTAEQFDTTSPDERRKAAAPAAGGGERLLGETVASLGDVARPGFWLETPLVDTPARGRVLNPATGKSAQVELIPIDGPKTGGSRLSLAAMRLIEAPLTDLPRVRVFAGE